MDRTYQFQVRQAKDQRGKDQLGSKMEKYDKKMLIFLCAKRYHRGAQENPILQEASGDN